MKVTPITPVYQVRNSLRKKENIYIPPKKKKEPASTKTTGFGSYM